VTARKAPKHVIAGFESQIEARAALASIARAARESGVGVDGAALARRGVEEAIHVDPLVGFDLPVHVLRILDVVVAREPGQPTLEVGETALVVSLDSAARSQLVASTLDRVLGADGSALWMTAG
jgi:hypothetical protein